MRDWAEGSSNPDTAQPSRDWSRSARRLVVAVASSLSALPAVSAAQSTSVDPAQPTSAPPTTLFEPALRAELQWTDNSGYLPRGLEQKDTILTLSGDVAFRRLGPRLGLAGSVGFDAIEYLDGT